MCNIIYNQSLFIYFLCVVPPPKSLIQKKCLLSRFFLYSSLFLFFKFISLFFISIFLYFTLFLHSSTARSFLVIIQKTKFENARIYRLKNIWLWICLVLSPNTFVIDQDRMLLQWLVLNVFDLYDYFVC